MPNAASGCLASARIVTGSPSESPASAISRANTPTGSRSSGAPAESSTARPQRPSSTATRRAMRAVGRHQRRRRARRAPPPRGWRARWPSPPPARSARSAVRHRAARFGVGCGRERASVPSSPPAAWPRRPAGGAPPRRRRDSASREHVLAQDSERADEVFQPELRVAEALRRRAFPPCRSPPSRPRRCPGRGREARPRRPPAARSP